ncbi:MAG: hypothetical protein FJZ01_24215 [Candidatus Sericytochromatia bacterium]|nr:hypothetical protein [Candidatus Tanganyikabacteria bacterium]
MDDAADDLPISPGPQRAPGRDTILRACQAIGSLMELWGFKRIHGALWTYLYLTDRPLDAQELREGLGISSGLVSMTLHELIRWGVVSRATPPGARRERYRAEPDIWRAVAKVLRERELFWLNLAMDDLRQAGDQLAHGQDEHPEQRQARARIDELLSLGELGGELIEGLLQVGTLDVRRLRQVRLGMGVAKLLERRRKR